MARTHFDLVDACPDLPLHVPCTKSAGILDHSKFQLAQRYRPGTPLQLGIGRPSAYHSPIAPDLLRALLADLHAGQPHGALVGDAIFIALTALLLPPSAIAHQPQKASSQERRIRRTLDCILSHLNDPTLNLERIAAAASSSPFHLSRCFRSAMGCSPWQYVLRERARPALMLMPRRRLSLQEVSQRAGFHAYSSFSASLRREYGLSPISLRTALQSPKHMTTH